MSDATHCTSCAGSTCGTVTPLHNNVHLWHVALVTNCNLRCSYCNTGYGMMGRKPQVMSREHQQRFIEVVLDRARGLKSVTMEFGIGETFIVFDEFMHFLTSARAAAAPRGLAVNASVSTNGVALDEKRLRILAEHGVGLRFSIDGPAEVHDANRKAKGGAGSHAQAIRNWRLYREIIGEMENPPSCLVNSVIGENSSLALVAEYWKSEGLRQFDAHIIDDSPYLPNKDGRYEKLRAHYLMDFEELAMREARRLTVPHFLADFWGPAYLYIFWSKLFLGVRRAFQRSSCGVGDAVLAVDPWGQYYPCDSFIGFDHHVHGSLATGLDAVAMKAMSDDFHDKKAECETCSANHLCNQGCAASHPEEGVVLNSHGGCDYFREIVRITERSYEVLCEPALEPALETAP